MNMPNEPSSQLPPTGPPNAAFEQGGAEPFPEEWLSAYVDDELTDEERAAVELGVAQDPRVAQLLDELWRVRGLVGQLPAWSGRSLPGTTLDRTSPESGSFENDILVNDSLESPTPALGWSRLGESSDSATKHNWAKSLGLAASLLIAASYGVWWLVSAAPLTVATNMQIADKQSPASGAATLAEATEATAAPAIASEFDAQAAEQSGATDRASLRRDRQMIEREEVLAPSATVPATSAPVEGGLAQPSMLNFNHAAAPASAAPAGQLPANLPAAIPLGVNSSESEPMVASQFPQGDQPPQVELVRSAGWTEAEVRQALIRLSPYLQTPGETTADRAADPALAAIPIALLAQKPAGWSSAELLAALQQPSLQLQAVAPTANDAVADDSAASAFRGAGSASVDQLPAAKAIDPTHDQLSRSPKTLALFVLREEAERIVQAAQQGNQLLAAPVWITPSNSTPQTTLPDQKVVLLVSPQ